MSCLIRRTQQYWWAVSDDWTSLTVCTCMCWDACLCTAHRETWSYSTWCVTPEMLRTKWKIDTVKQRYNGLTYNVSSVTAYASSWSRHFTIQNMSVSTYLHILLRTDFWAQTLQWTPASTYVRPPSRCLCSWLQSVTCEQSARHFDAVGMSPGIRMGCWSLVLIASNCC